MAFYVIYNDSILIAENEQALSNYYDNVQVLPSDYEADKYVVKNNELVLNENFEEEQKQKEHERIQELFMTRSDFFDGTIDAWGVGEDELLLVIKQLLGGLPFAETTKLKALNNFKNALNFYRKHTLFHLLVGQPIPLTENIQITLTDEALDKYFDEVNKGNKDTAWQYLPQPVAVPLPDHIEENLEVVEPEPDTEV